MFFAVIYTNLKVFKNAANSCFKVCKPNFLLLLFFHYMIYKPMLEQSLSKNNVLFARGDAKTYSPRRNVISFNVAEKLLSSGNLVEAKK